MLSRSPMLNPSRLFASTLVENKLLAAASCIERIDDTRDLSTCLSQNEGQTSQTMCFKLERIILPSVARSFTTADNTSSHFACRLLNAIVQFSRCRGDVILAQQGHRVFPGEHLTTATRNMTGRRRCISGKFLAALGHCHMAHHSASRICSLRLR